MSDLLKVTPAVMESHVSAINALVGKLDYHQTEIAKVVNNPALMRSGVNSDAITVHHEALQKSVTATKEQHTILGSQFTQHMNRMMSDDQRLSQMIE